MLYGKKDANTLQFLLIVMACISIQVIIVTLNNTIADNFINRTRYVLIAVILYVWLSRSYKLHLEAKAYIIALTIGFILHQLSDIDIKENLSGTLVVRIIPVFLMSMYIRLEKSVNKDFKWLMVFMLTFYVIETLMCFYERMTLSHVFSYSYRGQEDGFNVSMMNTEGNEYRATGLMAHPLFNANTISVAMAFILCSDKIKMLFKLALLMLGLLGLYGCNSRGVFLVWAVILVYRFVLYNRKWWQVVIAVGILYLITPFILDWLLHSGLLGRMEGFDFSDNSTNTRLIAFAVFAAERWNLQDIVVGGRLITYYASEITLENGVLLDLCYWGWIIGPIKIVSEIYLTWRATHNFPSRARVIIMLAMWGVAFMNNNSSQTWLFQMFVLFCIGFAPFQSKEGQSIQESKKMRRRTRMFATPAFPA